MHSAAYSTFLLAHFGVRACLPRYAVLAPGTLPPHRDLSACNSRIIAAFADPAISGLNRVLPATRDGDTTCLYRWRGRHRVRKRRHGALWHLCRTGVCPCMTTPDRGGLRKQARRERARRDDCEPPQADNTCKSELRATEAPQPTTRCEYYSRSSRNAIFLRGEWIAQAGFRDGMPIKIRVMPDCIVITTQNTRELYGCAERLSVAYVNRQKMKLWLEGFPGVLNDTGDLPVYKRGDGRCM